MMRVRHTLGGNVEEAILLDALRRGELADRAAIEEAEEALPGWREALERVIDDPIRELSVSIDQDTWPGDAGGVIEIVLQDRHLRRLDVDPPRSLRRRPYVAAGRGNR